jgi:hypothetical protein
MEPMTLPYRFRAGQPVVWFHQKAARSNQHCLYCGALVGTGARVASEKEHLIGRQFVPSGYLDGGAFNFIFRACVGCNQEKGKAERHLSTITLFSSPARLTSPPIAALAQRKAAKDFHPDRKGTLVEDSHEHATVRSRFGPMRATFELTAPPQPNTEAVQILACRHIQGLFSLVTSRDPTKAESSRLLPAQRVYFFGSYLHTDFGNPQLREVAARVSRWEGLLHVTTARGYFKAVLRRPPAGGGGWFWALEWNRCLRVVGGIAKSESELAFFQDLPALGWLALPDGVGRMREEIPLQEGPDLLFDPGGSG